MIFLNARGPKRSTRYSVQVRTCLQFLWCDTIGSRRTTKIIFTQKTVFSYLMGYPGAKALGAKAFVATYYCSICIPSTASFAKDETILLAIYCSLLFVTICVNHRVIPICSQPLLTHIPCYLFFYLHFISWWSRLLLILSVIPTCILSQPKRRRRKRKSCRPVILRFLCMMW